MWLIKQCPPSKASRRFCSPSCGYKARSGKNNPAWRGGVTLERQKLYNSKKWKHVVVTVYQRTNATRENCGLRYNHDLPTYHLHHIKPFYTGEDRCNPDNLALLCEECHRWVHSKENTEKKFLKFQDSKDKSDR